MKALGGTAIHEPEVRFFCCVLFQTLALCLRLAARGSFSPGGSLSAAEAGRQQAGRLQGDKCTSFYRVNSSTWGRFTRFYPLHSLCLKALLEVVRLHSNKKLLVNKCKFRAYFAHQRHQKTLVSEDLMLIILTYKQSCWFLLEKSVNTNSSVDHQLVSVSLSPLHPINIYLTWCDNKKIIM